MVSGDRYLPRGSEENVLSGTMIGNVSRQVVPMVSYLNFIMIH